MKNSLLVLGGISVLALTAACDTSHTRDENTSAVEGAEISKAVTNISHDGNVIRFTIPDDARSFDEAAQGATSAIYDASRPVPAECPVVPSRGVSKDIGDYDAISGKAEIIATFDKEDVADEVYEAGCLIVDDT